MKYVVQYDFDFWVRHQKTYFQSSMRVLSFSFNMRSLSNTHEQQVLCCSLSCWLTDTTSYSSILSNLKNAAFICLPAPPQVLAISFLVISTIYPLKNQGFYVVSEIILPETIGCSQHLFHLNHGFRLHFLQNGQLISLVMFVWEHQICSHCHW